MRYYLSAILLCFSMSCDQQVTPIPQSYIAIGEKGKALDSLITPYIHELRSLTDNEAGLAVGVTMNGHTIYARCFGYAHIDQRRKVDFNTVFHVASVSKPFVAFAIVKLMEQQRIGLEDKIVDLIPEFRMNGSGYESITVKHILTHSSGIPENISPDDWTTPSFGDNALEENLEIIKSINLEFEPGTEYSYSNSAFDLLGLVISRVSGVPFSDYVTSEVFKPTGMNHTSYKRTGGRLSPNQAMSYSYGTVTQEWHPYPYNERLLPSAGVLTTLNDMLRWTQMHLDNGISGGNLVLDEKYLTLLTDPHYDTPWGEKVGLSWFLQSYLDRPIVMHQGQDTGFESIVYLYPADGISIVVMANRDFSRTGRIINAISEALFDKELKAYEVSAKYEFTNAYHKGGIEQAKVTWEKLKQDSTDIYYTDDGDILTTGAILENGEHWNQTREILEFYNSLNPRSTYAWRLLGNAYLNIGDTTKALTHYEKCLELNPDYEKAREAIRKLEQSDE